MPRRWKQRVHDILDAIHRIQSYTRGLTFESFSADPKTVDAVVRNITVLGEAAVHLAGEIQSRAPELPWEEMRGIRNIVVHKYFEVSLTMLWQTIQTDLDPLIEPLNRLLEDAD